MPQPAALLLAASAILTLTACGPGPNVRSPRSYSAPAAPVVRYPDYNPHAPYGEANATWRPTIASRDGTIVRPVEPASQGDRPAYERAPWTTGAQDDGSAASRNAPAGTF